MTPARAGRKSALMSSRSIFLTVVLCAVSLGACADRYANVYSFRKSSFKAPPPETTKVVAPEPKGDVLTGAGVDPAGAIPGIPGFPAPGAPTGVPGLDAVPGGAVPPPPGSAPAIPGL